MRVRARGDEGLDDAERLLVSGSFERAEIEAAAARQDAGSTSERVAAECVWIRPV